MHTAYEFSDYTTHSMCFILWLINLCSEQIFRVHMIRTTQAEYVEAFRTNASNYKYIVLKYGPIFLVVCGDANDLHDNGNLAIHMT